MVLQISGTLRKRRVKYIGPFKREDWAISTFSCTVSKDDGRVDPIDDLWFQLVEAPSGYVLQGSVRGSNCIFAVIPYDTVSKKLPLVMNNVSGVELKGTILAQGSADAN
ncbi:MAG TPA: hypothetical protein VK934_01225 [Fimbriimonas sp.]|nr:hypothetical protein [Fimbriimonas sp.]